MSKEKKTFLYTLKGVDYKLRFDFNIVCDMEEAEGMDIPSLMVTGLPGFRKLTYYGLMDHKGMSKSKAGEIIQSILTNEETGLEYLAEKLKKVLSDGKFITTEEDDDDEDEYEENEKKS